jgi:general secretion pathway protein D
VSGCTTPIATPLTTVSQPRLTAGQPVSLEQTYAYDGGPTGAVPLPSPSSQAVAVMDGGNGSMIGGTYSKRKAVGADGNVVLNLAGVPLQQAAKTVLGDMIGVNYVVDPRVDGVISDRIGADRRGAGAKPRHLPDCAGRPGRHGRDRDR